MKLFRLRYCLLMTVLWLLAAVPAGARRADVTAFDLNEKAIAYLWNELDSAEQYAVLARDLSGRHSDERAKAVNTLARIAFIRMDYVQSWELYSSIPSLTGNSLEILASEIGLMRICQRTSDNVSFYEFRNSILLKLRSLHDESATLTPEQTDRLLSLERSFRMESARYYFELEQHAQAEYELSFVVADNRLRDDHDRYMMYTYMRGLGIGQESNDLKERMGQRLRSLDNCLRSSQRYGNVRMQAMSIAALCSMLLEYGTENVLSVVTDDMLSRLNASDVQPELLPTQLALKALQLYASYGDQYEIIESERLLASCYTRRGMYADAIGVLATALDMITDSYQLNNTGNKGSERLELYRPDHVILEEQWMQAVPHAVVPECMSAIREQISLAYSGMDFKAESDYNRTVYLEIQKNIRLDRRYEARTRLLQRSNRRLMGMLYAVAAAIVLLILFILLFSRRINAANRRYAELIRRTVELCESILKPAPQGESIIEWLNRTVSERLCDIAGARSITIDPDGTVNATWNGNASRDSRAVISTVTPYVKAAILNADELTGQEDRLRQAEKQHYLYRRHADRNKREHLARKTCCQTVAECLPYIDRMRSEIAHLSTLPFDSPGYEQSLQYVRELAERINQYNDLLSGWIRIRQGVVSLNVESFPLQPLLDIVSHGSRSFKLKGVDLIVQPSQAVVRADRALTLFMINTLADNARKFTPDGGSVTVEAVEGQDWVEIAVTDTGIGLSADDVHSIRDEKVFDAGQIGQTEGERQGKGSGFGLMNCKGIIEKYRKTDDIFKVCSFDVESTPGKGSRFSFRLPKGIRRTLCLLAMLFAGLGAKAQVAEPESEQDSLLVVAYNWADSTYMCNTVGRYEDALVYADSAFAALNADYIEHGGRKDMLLTVFEDLVPAETYWLDDGYATDYETILWLRNEIAVSALALRDWDVYRYNDDAYLKLFKIYYGEWQIEDDCRELQRTNSNLTIAVIVFVLIFILIVLIRYVVHSRHLLKFRSDLQQALRIVNRISELTTVKDLDKFDADVVVSGLADGIFDDLDHLTDMRQLIIVLNDDGRRISAVHTEGPVDERLDDRVRECLETGREQSSADGLCRALPLTVNLEGEERMIGAVGMRLEADPADTWPIVRGMVTQYLATALYSCVIRFQAGFRDIEQIEEESDRIRYEENRLHVSNLILDNCLSTLKHETVWYPNRILQLATEIEKTAPAERSTRQTADMQEVVAYYREIFGILSQYALSQTSGSMIHREAIAVNDLFEKASAFINKIKPDSGIEVFKSDLNVYADRTMLEYLIESLLERGLDYGGAMTLKAVQDGTFVRFELFRKCELIQSEQLDAMFTPLMNKDNMAYVICRQIIREHDDAFGHPGCRINAESAENGILIWFTVPAAKQ